MEIIPGFLVGFLGSLHCVGMCGPLVLALPRGSMGATAFVAGRLLYSVGRMMTYAALGAAVGSVGRIAVMAGWQQGFTIALGASLIASALVPSLVRGAASHLTVAARWTEAVRRTLVRLLGKSFPGTLFLTGLANGLLPCGFVYAALAAAAALGDPLSAALFMAGFGAGTLPVMSGIALLGPRLHNLLRGRWGLLIPVFSATLGALIVARGLNLGIPWLSPPLPPDAGPAAPACH